ncbi:MAG TPA: hypothetical protein VFW30_13910 [Bryocella sp.]|nr:hypothetical protein [Bryocella sp.]
MRRRSKAAGCFLLVGITKDERPAVVPMSDRGENASKVKADAKGLREQKMKAVGRDGYVAARQ